MFPLLLAMSLGAGLTSCSAVGPPAAVAHLGITRVSLAGEPGQRDQDVALGHDWEAHGGVRLRWAWCASASRLHASKPPPHAPAMPSRPPCASRLLCDWEDAAALLALDHMRRLE